MSQWYTIQFAQKTNMQPDSFGNESYNVKFTEEDDAVLWKVNPTMTKLDQGMKAYGIIENIPTRKDPAKTYRRFTRETPPDDVTGAPAPSISRKAYAGAKDDREDAIMQGRCYNNAAAIVSAFIINGVLEPDASQVAEAVQSMAEKLYNLPSLKKNAQTAPTQATEPKSTQAPLDLKQVDTLFPGAQTTEEPA